MGEGHVPFAPQESATVLCHTANGVVFFGTGFMGKKHTFTLSVRFTLYSFGVLGTRPFTHPVVRCDLDFYPFGCRSDSDFVCSCIFYYFQ